MNNDSDRLFKLVAIDGKPLNTSGMVDKRLFDGSNKLHIKMDKHSSLWYCFYDKGLIPQQMQQRFTSFNKALSFVKEYFIQRDIDVQEVVNA